jgi:ribosomal protein S18 acetylase RimI-like enzyme
MEEIIVADLFLPSHAEAIVHLLNEYAKDDMGGGSELSSFVKHNLVPELRKRIGTYVLLVFVDGTPAGLAICFEGFSTFLCKPLLNIHDLVISSEHRGRGISRRLLAKVEEIAERIDCCKITLEVLEGNAIAKHVYITSGYSGYELNPKVGKAMFWQKKLM